MGRRPKPTEQLQQEGSLRGTYGRDIEIMNPPAMSGEELEPPKWLSSEAKKFWYRVVPQLKNCDILKVTDEMSLAVLCDAWANYRALIERCGDYTENVPDFVAGQKNAAFSRWVKIAGIFGLSPADRAKLHIDGSKADKVNGNSRYFSGK